MPLLVYPVIMSRPNPRRPVRYFRRRCHLWVFQSAKRNCHRRPLPYHQVNCSATDYDADPRIPRLPPLRWRR